MSAWRVIVGMSVVVSSTIGYHDGGMGSLHFGQSRESARSEYTAVHMSAAKTLPWAVELESLYGDADHFITHYGFGQQPLLWNTEVFFGGRYELTMQVEVKVDYQMRRVEPVGKPRFFLAEVKTISKSPNGNDELRYSNDYSFDASQWRKVYDSGGDFSTIGITLIKKPVPGFSQATADWRKSRIPISLLPDRPATPKKKSLKEQQIAPKENKSDRSDGGEREKR